jgi:hypothetical protein
MHSDGDEIHVSEEEASGGSKEGVVRWVLVVGLLIAVVALSAIWITGAAFRDDPDADQASVSREIAEEQEQAAGNRGNGEPIAPSAAPETDERTVEDGVPVVEN